MGPGPRLVILGAIFGCTFLSIFLFAVTGGISYSSLATGGARTDLHSQAGGVHEQALAPASSGECAVSTRFPVSVLQWCDLITRYANQHGLSPDLVAALIWQESGGSSTAYSRSGAVGLMQVMPRDGLAASFMCKNGPCFTGRPTIEQLKDPEFNIAYGTRMLAGLLKRKGDMREALKSYGPMDVGYYYADRVLALFQNYGQ